MSAPLSHAHVWRAAPGEASTLLLLHGTGGDEHDLLPLAAAVAPRWNVLSPRGKVLEHGMPRFFRRHGEGVLDLDDLRRRAGELADFVAEASTTYAFDPRRVTALGYSNGANVALGVLFERPGTLRGAVLARAMLAYEPGAGTDLSGARVLLLAGERDAYSHRGVTDRLAALLRSRGADAEAHYAAAGHELVESDVARARAWLDAG